MSTHDRTVLRDGWELCSTEPGVALDPATLDALAPAWTPAVVPGTVAQTARCAGGLDLEHCQNFDDRDWWYRCRFSCDSSGGDARVLCFDGLATLADVWVDGTRALESNDMFLAHEVDISTLDGAKHDLVIRFGSLTAALAARRPRPRWRTKLVEHQQLRWVRTTLLGRMPGWSPPVRPVGPWRDIAIESRSVLCVESGDVLTSCEASEPAARAILRLRPLGLAAIHAAELEVGGARGPLEVLPEGDFVFLAGQLAVPHAELWWPHTHGAQPRYEARVHVTTDRGVVTIELGTVAFRDVRIESSNDAFVVVVNGVRVFCRGGCWTTPDIVTLGADDETYGTLLGRAREAGMNMIRVGGTMVYEADAFYDCCDRLGILVWQDFMFANMDYPTDDSAFMALVRREAESNLARLRRHPSLAVLCGNSEVEQQAAMLGVPDERWGRALFHGLLPHVCADQAPNAVYWPASPGGGALPFHPDAGVAHYYGVGAYLRPIDDARRSAVRFAAECLAFSNVPGPDVVDALLPNGESPVHHPRWKARVPRDHGAGWDFEDVRDHYLETLFGVHPMRLRYADMERYLALSRVVTGEVMARTIGEWRRNGSTCAGALIWVFQDLWLGAGWGVLDAAGRPKAAYYALKRAMQPVAVAITDEGQNGLEVHVTNDCASPLEAELRLCLVRDGHVCVATGVTRLSVPPRSATSVNADALLGRFADVAYAYRFGPPGHELVIAELRDASGGVVADAYHFPLGMPNAAHDLGGVRADAVALAEGTVSLTVRSERFAQSVFVDVGAHLPDDNFFHVAPGGARTTIIRPVGGTITEGYVHPLNARSPVRFTVRRHDGTGS